MLFRTKHAHQIDLKIVFQLVAFEDYSKKNIYIGKRETEEKHKVIVEDGLF